MALPGTGSGTIADRWKRMEQLFHAASDMDPHDRPAFLDSACGGDLALRLEVESLLESADKTLGMLQKPVQDAAQRMAAEAAAVRRIGPYELIRMIGSGGMGEVYLAARADDQFRRQVAIKLMRLDVGGVADVDKDRAMLPRFRAERQILADLDHPNIARLLDGGMTSDGVPYLVMEFVEGVPIDEYCRRKKLPLADRLRLFQTVCGAVGYAHHHLVIHRDIKPPNILVTADGVPKLLDFGIAKLLNPDDPSADPTRATQRLMTPEYASPEQILAKAVTTSADVYGLGVLLYELLSGHRPFKAPTKSPMEVAREVCEGRPPAPGSGSRELDAIVLKAMAKDPAGRYESAVQFSGDVAAYLGGHPVAAVENGWRYRAWKFVRRNKAGAAVALAIIIALLGFSAGMAVLARKANEQRLTAERESRFLVDLFRAATPEVARGETITARNLLDQGAKRVDGELASSPAVHAAMLKTLADAYQSLGLFNEAKTLAERSYRVKPDSDSLFLLANLTRLQGDYEKAEPLFRQLVAMRRAAAGENSAPYADALSALGECLYLQTKDREAEPLLRQALAIDGRQSPDLGADARNYLALLIERKGDYAEAAALLREAVEIGKRTDGVDSPSYAISLHNLASALIDQGDLSGAEARLRETLAIRRKVYGSGHPMLAYTLNNLGYVLLERGNPAAAEPFLREALELNRERLGEKHPSFAANLNNWGRLLQAQGKYAEAAKYFERGLENLRAAKAFPSWPAAQILANLGLLEFDQRRYEAAETWARQSLEMRRTLGGESTPALAASLIDLAEDEVFQGDPVSAEPLLRQALAIRRKKFAGGHPLIIAGQVRLGEALIAEGKKAEAGVILRDAVEAAKTAPFPLLPWQVAEAGNALAIAEGRKVGPENRAWLRGHPRPAFRGR